MILSRYVDMRSVFTLDPLTLDLDGMPVFAAKEDLSLIRPFRPWTNHEFPAVAGITMDLAGADDVTPFSDEWHWYLSEPAALTGANRWQLRRADPGGGLSRSGRVTFSLSSLGQALFSSQDPDLVSAMIRDVHIYAWNNAATKVYWADLHRCAFAPDTFPPSVNVIIT